MFTKKALITKWVLYSAALILFILLQQVLNALPAVWGVSPFLMPIIVALVAALEGPVPGTIFGICIGFFCDLIGGGIFSGIYTISFFCIALAISIISKDWVMHNIFGSLIYALISFFILDVFQTLFLLLFKGAELMVILSLAGREIAISILFTIPVFFLYNYLHRLFRYD